MFHILFLIFLSCHVYASNEEAQAGSTATEVVAVPRQRRKRGEDSWVQMLPEKHACSSDVCIKKADPSSSDPEEDETLDMRRIIHLDVSGYHLMNLNLSRLDNLQILDLSNKGLGEIPDLRRLERLEKLSLGKNELTVFNPEETLPNKTMQLIDLGYNKIREIKTGKWSMDSHCFLAVYFNNNPLTKSCFDELGRRSFVGNHSKLLLGLIDARKEIDSNSNGLTHIDPKISKSFPHGGMIEMGRNPVISKAAFNEFRQALNPGVTKARIVSGGIVPARSFSEITSASHKPVFPYSKSNNQSCLTFSQDCTPDKPSHTPRDRILNESSSVPALPLNNQYYQFSQQAAVERSLASIAESFQKLSDINKIFNLEDAQSRVLAIDDMLNPEYTKDHLDQMLGDMGLLEDDAERPSPKRRRLSASILDYSSSSDSTADYLAKSDSSFEVLPQNEESDAIQALVLLSDS